MQNKISILFCNRKFVPVAQIRRLWKGMVINMANQETATCVVCGRQYRACLSCKNQIRLKPWKSITDTMECYKIFLVITQYNNGYTSREEARKQLEAIPYNEDILSESVRNKIKEIMSVPVEQPKKTANKSADKKKCEE